MWRETDFRMNRPTPTAPVEPATTGSEQVATWRQTDFRMNKPAPVETAPAPADAAHPTASTGS